MFTIGPLALKQNPLIAGLYEQLGHVRKAMEAGDYDEAYRILEIVTETDTPIAPSDARHYLPDSCKDDLVAIQMFTQIVEHAPVPGFYESLDGLSIARLATLLADAQRQPERLQDRDLAILLLHASDCALSFEVEIRDSGEVGG